MLSNHNYQVPKRRLCFYRKTPVFPPKDARVSTPKTPVFLSKDACVFLQSRASFSGLQQRGGLLFIRHYPPNTEKKGKKQGCIR